MLSNQKQPAIPPSPDATVTLSSRTRRAGVRSESAQTVARLYRVAIASMILVMSVVRAIVVALERLVRALAEFGSIVLLALEASVVLVGKASRMAVRLVPLVVR